MADQGTEGLLSPFLRRQRFKAAKPYLNGRILDVGCGSGALAELVDPAWYVGIEVDEDSVNKAKQSYPHHFFQNSLPPAEEKFNTVVSLAVIEHVPDPAAFLSSLSQYLEGPKARIVITTPHPSVDWIHDVGASAGLFSQHANEEHEDLLSYEKLDIAGNQAGLRLVSYRRFLFGANQIAVFRKELS